MSIVVAVRKAGRTVMAADRQTSFGSEVLPAENQQSRKIRQLGDTLLGRAGWSVYENILDHWLADRTPPVITCTADVFLFFKELWKGLHDGYAFVNDQSRGKDTPFGDLGGAFLMASEAGIYHISPNMGVSEFRQYYAIGSGADYALGALFARYETDEDAESLARLAVEAGTTFNVHCGGGTEVLSV
jgi:ATP-dependent protease HslVU (ClpYQ) peptidase subunit